MRFIVGSFASVVVLSWVIGPIKLLAAPAVRMQQNAESRDALLFGGCGGAYFLAPKGELTIEVLKRDLHRRNTQTELRAILVGPDRRVIQEVRIADDGLNRGIGPLQSARLATRVDCPGIYLLNVTVSNDRYGQEVAWGFRTNCPRYLIETARGHKDERHQEPLVFSSSGRPADVCFRPRERAFAFDVSGLPKAVHEVTLFDGHGQLICTAPVSEDGTAVGTVPRGVSRDALPWRLHLAGTPATVNIDGLTRWDSQDLCPDVCWWSPRVEAWFPLPGARHLLTPYRRVVYGHPGTEHRIGFRVYNNSRTARAFRFHLEFPGQEWSAILDKPRVALRGREQVELGVTCVVPDSGESGVCRLRVEASEGAITTYSTIEVRSGAAPASRPLHLPLQLRPYEHENELFGYRPDYPIEWEPYFDHQNRPYVRTSSGLQRLVEGRWQTGSSPDVPFGSGRSNTKVAFDRHGNVYAIALAHGNAYLLRSGDTGKTFSPCLLGRSGSFDIEQFSGHNVGEYPPAVLRSVRTVRDPRLRWRSLNDLELLLPEWRDGELVAGDPIMLSRKSLGVGSHSGIPSAVVSRGPNVHVIWAEATDPAEKIPGVPTYVMTVDRKTRKPLGDPVLVGYGAPPNDVHNRPCLVMDGRGHLHALTGTHGQPFHYARSRQPNTAHAGWTKAEPVGKGLPQTYIGMVCGKDDTLHLVFRFWRRHVEPFPLATHATLAYQRKRPGQPWEPPRVLVVAPFSEYSIFYHRLTIDRLGRLFLSYDYWSTFWQYRNDHAGTRRALMMSADQGTTWKLVDQVDFLEGITEARGR